MNWFCCLNGTIVNNPCAVVFTCANNGDLVTFSSRFTCLIEVFDMFFSRANSIATGTMAISIHGITMAVDNSDRAIVFNSCIKESIN